MEIVFICSVGIYRCEKSSSIKSNINMTHNFDMLYRLYLYMYAVYNNTMTRVTQPINVLIYLNSATQHQGSYCPLGIA